MAESKIPAHQQAGYDAVYEVIRQASEGVRINRLIWHAVEAYRVASEAVREQSAVVVPLRRLPMREDTPRGAS